jgi:hypothetical protein
MSLVPPDLFTKVHWGFWECQGKIALIVFLEEESA